MQKAVIDTPEYRERQSRADREPQQVELVDLLRGLLASWKVLAVSVLLPIIGTWAYVHNATPIYTARTQLLLDPNTPLPLNEQVSIENATFDNPQVESQIAVLRSEKIARTVAEKLKLRDDAEFAGPIPEQTDPNDVYRRTRLTIRAIGDRLDVRRISTSFAFEITFSSQNGARAADVANAVAEAFIEDQLTARAEAVTAGSKWLEQRIEDLRRLMNDASLKTQEFRVKRDYRLPGRGSSEGSPNTAREQGAEHADGGDSATTLEELEATAQTYRRLYEGYLQAYTEGLQRQSIPVTKARVITRASPPLEPSHPRSKLLLALAAVVGLTIGLGLALVMRGFETSPRPSS